MSEVATETVIETPAVEAATPDTATVPETVETPTETGEQPKYDYVPAKFLKADGTPDFEKLAKSYSGLEKKLGSKPNIPASAIDEYETEGDVEFDAEQLNAFKAKALAKGFTKDQYTFAMETHKRMLEGIKEGLLWHADKTEAVLKEQWGKDYDANTQAAKAGFDEFAPSDANPNDPVWNHPIVMKLLARIGAEVGEDSVARKGSTHASPEISDDEIGKLLSSKEYRSGHAETHAKVAAYYARRK